MTIRAAGILFMTATGEALFVKRAATADHAGEWSFPGGHIEAGESAEAAACREAHEELGTLPDGDRALLMRRIADDAGEEVDFTTFLQRVPERFEPTLNGEHSGFAWTAPETPPEPLHPGARVALARLAADELGVARMMAAGELAGPQRYGKFWLFAIRLTGTGIAYRNAVKDAETGKVLREAEYCWRDPAIYLDPEFLARANGLPVLFEHPTKKPALDSEEFHNRIVGTTFLPFIKGDEVWAIVKIYDESCIAWMLDEQVSTSPAVVFSAASGNEKLKLSDGTDLLIEGKPALVDHIALVGNGVWDKGGAPSGVDSQPLEKGTLGMTDEERAAAEKARKDADEKLDRITDALKRVDARLDSFEAADKARHDAEEKERADCARLDAARKDRFGARKDGEAYKDWKGRHDADEAAMREELEKGGHEKAAADKAAKDARKDAEEAERKDGGETFAEWAKQETEEPDHQAAADKARKDAEEKERMDKARHDAALAVENVDLKTRLAALETSIKGLTTEVPASERDALAAAQSRADSVAAMFGERASAPIPGERPVDYRKRLLARYQRHSPRFKDSRFDSLDAAMLQPIEEIVYADAVTAAKSPDAARAGVLLAVEHRDSAGRTITTYNGDPMAWMQHFMTGAQVGRIVRLNQRGA